MAPSPHQLQERTNLRSLYSIRYSMAITNSLSTLLLLLLAPHQALSLPSTDAEFLNSHNAVRARLGLPPLQWSYESENFAKPCANQRRGDCALVHSPGDFGENLFWGKGKRWKIADAKFHTTTMKAIRAKLTPTAPMTPRWCGGGRRRLGVPRSFAGEGTLSLRASMIPMAISLARGHTDC